MNIYEAPKYVEPIPNINLGGMNFPSLREKCPNMDLFVIRIFMYSCIYSVNLRIQSEYWQLKNGSILP